MFSVACGFNLRYFFAFRTNDCEGTPYEFVIEDSYEVDKKEYSDLVIEEIIELVKSKPNDFELGSEIRKYINKLEE